MTFKPTVITTPQPEKLVYGDRMTGELNSQPEGGAPGTGQPGDPSGMAPALDQPESQPQPAETETPQSESVDNVDEYAGEPAAAAAVSAGDGEPGPLTPPRAFGLHTTEPQKQAVKDDRGVVTTFLSDRPQK